MERNYIDSGNPIIGNIPKGWQLMRLKNVGYLYGGLTGKAGDDFDVDEDKDNFAYYIPFTNIFNNTYISPNVLGKVKVSDKEIQNKVHKGDLLFLMSSEDFDGIGKPAVIDFEMDNLYLNSFCKGFRITSDINFKYLNYMMLSHVERELVRLEAKGFIRINLRQDKLACCEIIIPSRIEQDKIADYLDTKCGEIDSLIGLQTEMIEKLKAYKQSVITEAVTKGLDPNAKLVQSGIDWIGEIPEEWKVCKLKNQYTLLNGRAYSDSELLQEGKYRILRVGNLFSSDKWYYSDMELEDNKYCSENDLLYGWSASIGPLIWKGEKVIYHYHIWKVLFYENNLRFSYYLFDALTHAKKRDMHGSAMQHLTKTNMDNSWIPTVPIDQQHSIAAYLDEKCADIDHLIALKQQKIEKLEDYKKSIICEAITGKITID